MAGAAVGSAAIGATTSAINAGLAFKAASDERKFAGLAAKAAFGRTIKLRATAYQSTVKDLRAAGLNPILAVGNGPTSAQSGPAPAAGKAQLPGLDSPASAYQEVMNQIEYRKKSKKERQVLGDQGDLMREQGKTQVEQRRLNSDLAHKARTEARYMRIQAQLAAFDLPAASAKAAADSSAFGQDVRKLNRFGEGLGLGTAADFIKYLAGAKIGQTKKLTHRRGKSK